MSDPVRLRDERDEGEFAELLLSAKPTRGMSKRQYTRSAGKVAVIAAAPTAGILLTGKSWAIVAAITVGGGLAAAVGNPVMDMVWGPAARGGASSIETASPPTTVAPTAFPKSPISDEPPPVDEPVEPAPPILKQDTATPAPSAPSDTLAAEVELLEQARARLGTNPSAALLLLSEHAQSFPNGKLSIERDLLRLDGLIRVGRHADARTLGSQLVARTAGGLYEERAEQLLSSIPQ